jgi:hypothetical protein
MLRKEFVGDLGKLMDSSDHPKYVFKLKSRDEHLKEMMDPQV